MDVDMLMMEAEERMEGAIKGFQNALNQARTGRANPKLIEGITISYYGVDTLITQIASTSIPEGNQIYIKPYDKSTVSLISKAIFAANLGVTPQDDGVGVRIILPPMTEENRRNTVKEVNKCAEAAKVQLRNIRQDANNGIKQAEKNKEISEDERDAYLEDVQKLVDDYTKKIEKMLDEKVKDVMTI